MDETRIFGEDEDILLGQVRLNAARKRELQKECEHVFELVRENRGAHQDYVTHQMVTVFDLANVCQKCGKRKYAGRETVPGVVEG